MQLSTDARKELRAILLDAYPGVASFAMVLELNGRNFEDYIEGGGRREKYTSVIIAAEAGNWVDRLISAVYDDQEGNVPTQAALHGLANQIQTEQSAPESPLRPGMLFASAFSDAADNARTLAFQRMVRRGQSDIDIRSYLAAIARVGNALCTVEWDGQHQGTGFLLGYRTIITNQHVINDMPTDTTTGLTARFGYVINENGQVRNGTPVDFDDDWLVFSRPPDPSDEADASDVAPAPQNLDYSIVRLAQAPAGHAPVSLSRLGTPKVNNDMTIIQHPNGAPQKLSLGRLSDITGANRRLRYDANTKKGSSGSPVCDHSGLLIGLHHTGDPNFSRMASYNQAVMFALIAQDIEDNNIELI